MSTDRQLHKQNNRLSTEQQPAASSCFTAIYKWEKINMLEKKNRPDELVEGFSLLTSHSTHTMQAIYLGVRISLYCSFSTRVVAATDIGITMLLMSKELSPRLLLMGCCWGTKNVWANSRKTEIFRGQTTPLHLENSLHYKYLNKYRDLETVTARKGWFEFCPVNKKQDHRITLHVRIHLFI